MQKTILITGCSSGIGAALAAEFARRLREDPDFAASPSQRLEFFLPRHPAWDEQLNLYPVFRVEQRPVE